MISVAICSHNPRPKYLQRTLHSVKTQTYSKEWELLLIDNGSEPTLASQWDLSWHRQARHVREAELGLTAARIRALAEAQSELMVFVDDDNILAPDYLEQVASIFSAHNEIGVAGGRSSPEYETPPPSWFSEPMPPLGCRDLGEEIQIASWNAIENRTYPTCAPVGGGMAIRRRILELWAEGVETNRVRRSFGRRGQALSSGEDNDINLVALNAGYSVGYFPNLFLSHLIPRERLCANYLERLSFASSRDWVRVLRLHGISPWRPIPAWTLPFRCLRAWLANRAWRGPAERIRWKGACGIFAGQVE